MDVYGTCVSCGFEASGETLEQLDAKFKHHFVLVGHSSYFHEENSVEKIRKVN